MVMETADVEVHKLRAELMTNGESRMSAAEWGNTAWFPEYIEVLQVESSDPQTGLAQSEDTSAREERATEEESKPAAEARATDEAMRAEMSELSEKVEKATAKFEENTAKVESMEGKVDAMAGDVAKIMQLLQHFE